MIDKRVSTNDNLNSLVTGLGSIAIAQLAQGYMPTNFTTFLTYVGIGSFGFYGWDYYTGNRKYTRLFKAIGLKNKEDLYPRFKRKKNTEHGYQLLFSLPVGLSTDDFDKHKSAIEQNLNVPNIDMELF